MSEIDLKSSIARAERRFRGGVAAQPNGVRADRGRARIPEVVERELQRLLQTPERPALSEVAHEIAAFCGSVGCRPPSRSSVYNAVARAKAPEYQLAQLPEDVVRALYNLEGPRVGGGQLVFHAFNYGSPRAISFAAGLPWLCLVDAAKRRGWRPKSRSLLTAVMQYRGI